MREILFRGRTTRDKEWVYGDLLHDGYDYDIAIWERNCKLVTEISPETVGQFTGLIDKNGKKIFENDIVVICYETDGKEFSETKRVHYNEKECCWYPMRWEECCEYCDYYTEVKSIEIIGNIHDNPELLEENEWNFLI